MWAKLRPASSSNSTFNKRKGEAAEQPMAPKHLSKTRSSVNIVDEEYSMALHTKSYVDLYSRVHHQLKGSSTILLSAPPKQEQGENEKLQHTISSSLSYRCYDDNVPDFVIEPRNESLLTAASDKLTSSCLLSKLNKVLQNFFDTTLQASTACASLLSSIDRARSHHRSIHQLLLNLSSGTPSSPSSFPQLSSHLEYGNPFSPQILSQFHTTHLVYPRLIGSLTCAHKKIARRLKLVKFTKKALGMAIVALLGAVVVAAVVIATHGGAVAVAAVPMTAATCTSLRRPRRWFRGWIRLERARAKVDAAAKGAYTVRREMETLSQMLRRVHDEIEHGRDLVRMVVRNRERFMMREVLRVMEGKRGEMGLGFEEQLQELEEHVYLCLITIDRSRRLVAQEMMLELREASIRD